MRRRHNSTTFGAATPMFAIVVMTCCLGDLATAAIVYGDFSDVPPGGVMYLDVEESSFFPEDDEPLFGLPNILGDRLEFDPTDRFSAVASNGLRDDTVGSLQFVLGGEGVAISTLAIDASGEYTLSGNGAAATTLDLRSSVTNVTVLAVDGRPVATPIVLPEVATTKSFDLSGGTVSDMPWDTQLSYDLSAALSNAGVTYQYGVTKIEVGLSTTLSASSESSSIAEVSINRFTITAKTIPIPEPGSLVLAGLALSILAMHRG